MFEAADMGIMPESTRRELGRYTDDVELDANPRSSCPLTPLSIDSTDDPQCWRWTERYDDLNN